MWTTLIFRVLLWRGAGRYDQVAGRPSPQPGPILSLLVFITDAFLDGCRSGIKDASWPLLRRQRAAENWIEG